MDCTLDPTTIRDFPQSGGSIIVIILIIIATTTETILGATITNHQFTKDALQYIKIS